MSTFNIKVSVIIPFYKVETYFYECLDSVINQTQKDIEIICVYYYPDNNSLEILKNYVEKDDRIIILNQENKDIASARNTGLNIARGEYVYFLDPYDFIELTFIEEVYEKAKNLDLDIVVFGSNYFLETKKEFSNIVEGKLNGLQCKCTENFDVFSYKDIPDDILISFGNVVWNKIFKRSFLFENDIVFSKINLVEDIYFINIALTLAKKISIINKIFVYHRIYNKYNITKLNLSSNHIFNSIKAIKDKLIQLDLLNDVKLSFNILILDFLICNLNEQKTYIGFKSVYECIVSNFEKEYSLINFFKNKRINDINSIKQLEEYQMILTQNVDEYLEIKQKYFIDETDTSIRVSVIIPVYNVEKYLRECLDSVINQTLYNIEIICINDGSTDSSSDILREYADKDRRIIIINQRNQGLSATRNKGISLAKGKYIYFLDSDDKIELYALDLAFTQAVTNNLDILLFDGKCFYESAQLETEQAYFKTAYNSKFNSKEIFSGAKIFAKLKENDSYWVQSSLYITKTKFLKTENILFDNGILHEDNIFMFKIILTANRVKHIKDQLFVHRIRANSIMTQELTFEHFYGYFFSYIQILEYSNKFVYTESVENAIIKILNSIFANVLNYYKRLNSNELAKINKLTKLERYYFDTIFLPKLESKIPNNDDLNKVKYELNVSNLKVNEINNQLILCQKELIESNEINRNNSNQINGQLNWARAELEKVRAERLEYKKQLSKLKEIKLSFSYKIGALITWLPRKIKNILN